MDDCVHNYEDVWVGGAGKSKQLSSREWPDPLIPTLVVVRSDMLSISCQQIRIQAGCRS
jgi:hypothetical protein